MIDDVNMLATIISKEHNCTKHRTATEDAIKHVSPMQNEDSWTFSMTMLEEAELLPRPITGLF